MFTITRRILRGNKFVVYVGTAFVVTETDVMVTASEVISIISIFSIILTISAGVVFVIDMNTDIITMCDVIILFYESNFITISSIFIISPSTKLGTVFIDIFIIWSGDYIPFAVFLITFFFNRPMVFNTFALTIRTIFLDTFLTFSFTIKNIVTINMFPNICSRRF